MTDRIPSMNSAIKRQTGDDELLHRVRKSLTRKNKPAWRVVRVGVKSSVVRLTGVVPSADDRNLIATVVAEIPGVKDVDDRLTIEKKAAARPAVDVDVPASSARPVVCEQSEHVWRNEFLHLPELSESLEGILSKLKTKPIP